ncbi:small secreted domain DUF320 [Herbihabitans rhizosphaerae]|uniref:Small secreted domain DUF320 n=1 Tax=Herbihabitans rhizosphaerae TaxID=1872711 RepID=A0A4Q7KH89_9PSEU|nr:chaplin family protein [Herbihabitans rhizosphaerae]RZS32218.1 small secreted domain DUF320 [Herbihabitans rhizosphaerae]
MHIWARRGLQTALVTGGLLMLGTGIASADERVDPDRPASPLDGGITIPVDIGDNALGTPLGQLDLPGYQGEISTKQVTAPLSQALQSNAPVTKPTPKPSTKPAPKPAALLNGLPTGMPDGQCGLPAAKGAKAPVCETTPPVPRPDKPVATADDAFLGNRVNADLVVPLQITGNAIAAPLSSATVAGSSHSQTYDGRQDIETGGNGSALGGNVVDLDWAVPVQLSNNAVAWAGSAQSIGGNAEQDVVTGGDTTTDGRNGSLAGNVLAGHWATPVQATGNAVSWGGNAQVTDSTATNYTESGGAVDTAGRDGTLSGNAGAAPLALPVEVNGNAPTWGGRSDVQSSTTTVDAIAGGTKTGINDIPTYVQTDGDQGAGSGNIVQPQGAGIANVASVAAAWTGIATTGGATAPSTTPVPIPSPEPVAPMSPNASNSSSRTDVTSGGFSSTSSEGGVLSGNLADAPVAVPAEVFGIGGTWGGIAHALHDNESTTVVGGGTYTNGDKGTLAGNTASTPVASSPDVFAVGGSWIGMASGQATNDKVVQAGGYNGTRGNEGTGSGNLITGPVALPAELFGVGGSWVGSGTGIGEETKVVKAGGGGNTEDPCGVASSNLVAAPLSTPAQVFGIGGAWIGRGVGEATNDTESTAGGDYKTTGGFGTITGNLVQAPGSLPAQVHGIGAAWGGFGQGVSDNETDSTAGGHNLADGEGGQLAGNVVQAPVGSTAGVFALAPVWVGRVTGDATNEVTSTAGGDTETNGDAGQISGNVISGQALPVAQVFGNAASFIGASDGSAINETVAESGGDITTSGLGGSLSGNIADVPAAAVAQVFGNSAAVAGTSYAWAANDLTGQSGGTTTTTGGQDLQIPVGAVAQVFEFSPALVGEAEAMATNITSVTVDETPAQVNVPVDGSGFSL